MYWNHNQQPGTAAVKLASLVMIQLQPHYWLASVSIYRQHIETYRRCSKAVFRKSMRVFVPSRIGGCGT